MDTANEILSNLRTKAYEYHARARRIRRRSAAKGNKNLAALHGEHALVWRRVIAMIEDEVTELEGISNELSTNTTPAAAAIPVTAHVPGELLDGQPDVLPDVEPENPECGCPGDIRGSDAVS